MSPIQPARRHSHNNHLQTCILAIKYYTNKPNIPNVPPSSSLLINAIKATNFCHQLNRINSAQTLPLPFQTRLTFSFANIAHNYQEQNLKSQHTALFESAKIKLSSSNKTHNYATKSLPPDTISLFNKGPNFIPTTATTSISSPQETVTSEVNTCLCSLIHKKNYPTRVKSSNTTKSLCCFHPSNKKLPPLPLLHQEQSRPHYNLHLIDYVDNTVSFTKEFLQPAKYCSIIYPILSSTYPHTTSYIPDIHNDNDIINLQWLTKTWAGP